MKKIFTLILVLFTMCVTANGQNGNWKTTVEESFTYSNTEGTFVWENNTHIKIGTHNGNFDFKNDSVFAMVSFYNKEGELMEYEYTYLYAKNEEYNIAYITPNLGDKIINHLSNVGNVRIIISKYNEKDFDLTIPMNPTLYTFPNEI